MSMRRHRAPLLLAILLAAMSTSGCIQWGEYAMSAECTDFSEEVQEAVHTAYGQTPQIANKWAGEDDTVWCTFDVLTGQDVAIDDESRIKLRNELQALLEETFSSGVEVTLFYAADQDFLLLDTRESVARVECRTISERVEKLVLEHYGDDAYLFQVWAPADDLGDAECTIEVITQKDLSADDPARLEAGQAVQGILPDDVEVRLVYADGRDRIDDSHVITEHAPNVP